MQRKLYILGSILGLLAVILGAFGAHGLKAVLTEESLNSYETGVRYQFYHALFLFMVANASFISDKVKNILFYLILVGVVLFSGSIYLLSTSGFIGVSFTGLALFTPLGGLFLISAWAMLLVNLLKMKRK